ncbi:MAG: hypothetical protein RLO08_05765 [Parvibaculaceae bacterium]|jgi:hypothetical protein
MTDHEEPGDKSENLAVPEAGPSDRLADRFAKPTWAQIRYLIRGLKEPGGKLPLFDDEGQEIDARTIRSCIARGWAEPWFANPVKPDWLVCRLTPSGYRILGVEKPPRRS